MIVITRQYQLRPYPSEDYFIFMYCVKAELGLIYYVDKGEQLDELLHRLINIDFQYIANRFYIQKTPIRAEFVGISCLHILLTREIRDHLLSQYNIYDIKYDLLRSS